MKAQVAIEYLAVFGLVLTMFVVVNLSIISTSNQRENLETVQNAERIAANIGEFASLAGHSHVTTQIYLPVKLTHGVSYSISFSNSSISINWQGKSGARSLFRVVHASRVSNPAGETNFTLNPGSDYRFEPNGNGITVKKV